MIRSVQSIRNESIAFIPLAFPLHAVALPTLTQPDDETASNPLFFRPGVLGILADADGGTGFPAIEPKWLESSRSSITFRGDTFDPRITVLAFIGERGEDGTTGSASLLGLPLDRGMRRPASPAVPPAHRTR